MRPGQDNVLLRINLRPMDRTMTADEANAMRNRIYAALHEGRDRSRLEVIAQRVRTTPSPGRRSSVVAASPPLTASATCPGRVDEEDDVTERDISERGTDGRRERPVAHADLDDAAIEAGGIQIGHRCIELHVPESIDGEHLGVEDAGVNLDPRRRRTSGHPRKAPRRMRLTGGQGPGAPRPARTRRAQRTSGSTRPGGSRVR